MAKNKNSNQNPQKQNSNSVISSGKVSTATKSSTIPFSKERWSSKRKDFITTFQTGNNSYNGKKTTKIITTFEDNEDWSFLISSDGIFSVINRLGGGVCNHNILKNAPKFIDEFVNGIPNYFMVSAMTDNNIYKIGFAMYLQSKAYSLKTRREFAFSDMFTDMELEELKTSPFFDKMVKIFEKMVMHGLIKGVKMNIDINELTKTDGKKFWR